MSLNQHKLFAEIRATLLAAATQYPTEIDAIPVVAVKPGKIVGGRYNMRTTPDTPAVHKTAVFMFGTFKITCAATQEAILKVAAKYSRIPNGMLLSPPPNYSRKPAWMNMKRPADADAKLAALEAEFAPECDDAEEIAA